VRRFLKWAIVLIVVLFVVIQLIPATKTNPQVTQEVKWDSPETKALAVKACYDCHSNETVWPWESNIAPLSWYLANHVSEGRSRLNFSEWDKPNAEAEEIVRSVQDDKMPLWDYTLMHSNAKLTDAERAALVAGLTTTLQQDPPIPGQERGEGGEGGEGR
jgi:hypothetical protein